MSYEVSVSVMLKPGIADPQGQTIERAFGAAEQGQRPGPLRAARQRLGLG